MNKVFLNPGHDAKIGHCGPIDSGAFNEKHGLLECDYVKGVCEKIQQKLSDAGCWVTSEQDNYLSGICTNANLMHTDIFVSVHCNACASHLGKGFEVWCYSRSGEGHRLANNVLKAVDDVKIDGLINRGVKEDDGSHYGVLILTDMPAIIVECAFIDNEDDYQILIDHVDDFAEGISKGIINYFDGGK